jgi:hypothetical protein
MEGLKIRELQIEQPAQPEPPNPESVHNFFEELREDAPAVAKRMLDRAEESGAELARALDRSND